MSATSGGGDRTATQSPGERLGFKNGTVVQELIPGYLLAGRLLRAAMVGVSKGGPPRAATADASNDA